MQNHLVLFAKAPRLGAVKTRLARDIGAVAAWAFYRRALAEAVRRLRGDRRWRLWLAVAPDRARHDAGLWPRRIARLAQGPGDLGRRMARVLRRLPPGPAAIVGADIPDLNAEHVARAFRSLGSFDAVFGPAADGGYWLVGLRRRPRWRDPFAAVRWSSRHALADTLANLKGARIAPSLDTLDDIDDGAAWRRWQRSLRSSSPAPAAPARTTPAKGRTRRRPAGPARSPRR